MFQGSYRAGLKRRRPKQSRFSRAAKRYKKDIKNTVSSHQQPDYTSYTKLGVLDLGYHDTQALSSYSWQEITPNGTTNTAKRQRMRILSLKELCCQELSTNASLLSTEMLEHVAQPCLLMLWKYILSSGNDSISVFTTFASILQHAKQFKCHRSSSTNYITHYVSPETLKYRLDNLFSNIDYTQFSLYMNSIKLDHLTVLDFSGILVSRETLLLALKIKSLAAVGLSNCNLDNNTLYYISSAIKDGRLQSLLLLKINGNNQITFNGLSQFFQLPISSALCIVIADDLYKPSFHSKFSLKDDPVIPVEGTRWLLQKSSNKEITRFLERPLGIQLQHISRLFNQTNQPLTGHRIDDQIVWDFMVMEKDYDPTEKEDLLQYMERKRIGARTASSYATACYTLDRSRDIKVVQQHTAIKDIEQDSLFTRQQSAKKKKVVQKRKKPKATNDINELVSIAWRS